MPDTRLIILTADPALAALEAQAAEAHDAARTCRCHGAREYYARRAVQLDRAIAERRRQMEVR